MDKVLLRHLIVRLVVFPILPDSARGLLFFTVIVLIGTGWSYMKATLTQRDKKFVALVFGLQVIVNIAIVVVDESSPGFASWIRWRDILHVVDIVCCCLTLFPIVWSVRNLRAMAANNDKG